MSEQKRKLIFFWPYLEWGGAQVYFLAIIKEAVAAWNVTVVLPRASSAELIRFIQQTGVNIEFLDFHSDLSDASTLGQKIRRQFRRVKVEVASYRYLLRYKLSESVLHIEFPPWQSWLFFTALAVRRANVFVTMHNALPETSTWRVMMWKLRMQFVSRLPGFHIFTSNNDAKNKLRGWVEENFWQNIRVTYTSVNPPEIEKITDLFADRAELRKSHGIAKDKFIVLCVGQFIDRKGRWVFLDAAKLVAEDRSDILFVWLGPSKPSKNDQARIDGYELGDRFRFVLSDTVGTRREDVLQFFNIANVFALASFVEGLPIALLEAMALGIPSISTNVYAIPEAIKPLETGLLIEPGDASALAKAIIRLRQDDELCSRLSKRASEFVLRNFDERVASQTAIDAYMECF